MDHRRDALPIPVPDALQPQGETILLREVDAHALCHRWRVVRAARAIEANEAVPVCETTDRRRTDQPTATGHHDDVLHLNLPPWPAAAHVAWGALQPRIV